MERFVFVAAVTIAIILALTNIVGRNVDWSVDFDGMDGRRDPVLEVAAGRMEAQSFDTASIALRRAAARVVITPEDRTDIVVEIDNPGRLPMPELELDDDRLMIDGRLGGRIDECLDDSVDVRGYGDIPSAELPLITIRAPRTLSFDSHGASNAEIGPSESFRGSFSGCGGANIADVAGELELEIAGSGEVHAAAARSLTAELAGSGALRTGAVAEGASIEIAGSGEVSLASLSGDLDLEGAGSGQVHIEGGAIATAEIELAGSGDVNIAAPVRTLNVTVVGSGDVDVDATVGDIEAEIAGSGSVNVAALTGALSQQAFGSGSVVVGHRAVPAVEAPPAAPAPLPPAPSSP